MSESKKDKYLKLLKEAKSYNDVADSVKKEFFDRFSKDEMFELMWSYRTLISFYAFEIIYPKDKEKAAELLRTSERVAIYSARERVEKDGKVKKMRKKLEKDISESVIKNIDLDKKVDKKDLN